MDVRVDEEADAIYIRLSDEDVAETRTLDERTMIDVNEDGNVVGVELLDASNRFPDMAEFNVGFGHIGQAEA